MDGLFITRVGRSMVGLSRHSRMAQGMRNGRGSGGASRFRFCSISGWRGMIQWIGMWF